LLILSLQVQFFLAHFLPEQTYNLCVQCFVEPSFLSKRG
jgi:hypothetical protein